MKSQNGARPKVAMAGRLSASVVLIVLGLVSQTVPPSTHLLARAVSNSAGLNQSSQRTSDSGNGIIVGLVVNERQEPVARVTVQAFSARATGPGTQPHETVPFSTRASGSASTDTQGRFQIAGLELGEYLVAAEPVPLLPSIGSRSTSIYATTFYPSTVDNQLAVRVSASAHAASTIQIELVRVKGARVSGSVVSSSGRSAEGMSVTVFHRFGSFGMGSSVAVVDAKGAFEIPRVPPCWYRLTIEPRPGESKAHNGEFATRLIEVQDRDLDGLSLVSSPGASISGRIVAAPGASIQNPFGLRVNASPTPEQFSPPGLITATVAGDGSLRMTGFAGF